MEVVEVAVEVAVDAVEVDRVIDPWSLVRGLCGVIPLLTCHRPL